MDAYIYRLRATALRAVRVWYTRVMGNRNPTRK